MNLIYNNEKKLYVIVLIISLLIWSLAIVGTAGLIFVYLLFGFIIYLFAQSGLIAYLKGSGVRISAQQFPELYHQYVECCQKLDMKIEPELYILNSDGILNAFATRFLRRNYIVLYSSILDALKKYPDGLNFYIGHELGHIKRGHLNLSTIIWPGMLLPLLGSAYSRAREYSCDLHGLHCCKQPKDAAFGMAVLVTGEGQWNKLNVNNYMDQSKDTGSFWMSFHELTNDYPWLCKRMQHIMDKSEHKNTNFPKRNIFAVILALFVPRLGIVSGTGGIASLLIIIAIIGILAAVAIPAYQDYSMRAKVAGAALISNQIIQNATPYIIENGSLPHALNDINLPKNLSNNVIKSVSVTDKGFILYTTGHAKLEGKTIIYQPYKDDNKQLQWRCNNGSLNKNYLPSSCRN